MNALKLRLKLDQDLWFRRCVWLNIAPLGCSLSLSREHRGGDVCQYITTKACSNNYISRVKALSSTHSHSRNTYIFNIWDIFLTLRRWILLNNFDITFAIIHQTHTARGTEIVIGRMVHLWICLVCVRLSCFLSVMRSGQELDPQLDAEIYPSPKLGYTLLFQLCSIPSGGKPHLTWSCQWF